jgi:hypothetical protein
MSEPTILSHPVSVDRLRSVGERVVITADAGAREAIARANGLPEVSSFVARLEAKPWGRDGVAVSGVVEAQILQVCGVSLETFPVAMTEPVEVLFAPPTESRPETADDGDGDDLEEPDPLIGNSIDLGKIALEFFVLGLDPYPRKPGASFADHVEDDGRENPFAALAKLKPNGGENTA